MSTAQDSKEESAIVQQMRQDGVLPRWERTSRDPVPVTPINGISLTLDGGLRFYTDDQFHSRVIYTALPSETTKFAWDTPLDQIAAELPARLLTVLRAAVTDLEQIVAHNT